MMREKSLISFARLLAVLASVPIVILNLSIRSASLGISPMSVYQKLRSEIPTCRSKFDQMEVQ